MQKKTTAIGETWHPLEVEWNVHTPHKRMPDGSFREVEEHQITLTHPGWRDGDKRIRIIDFSPRTALNLLAWLRQEQMTLERLVTEEEAPMENG